MTSLKGETRPRSSCLILHMFSTERAGKTYSQSRVIYQRRTNCRILSYQGKHSGAYFIAEPSLPGKECSAAELWRLAEGRIASGALHLGLLMRIQSAGSVKRRLKSMFWRKKNTEFIFRVTRGFRANWLGGVAILHELMSKLLVRGVCAHEQKRRSRVFGVTVQLLIVKPNWKPKSEPFGVVPMGRIDSRTRGAA